MNIQFNDFGICQSQYMLLKFANNVKVFNFVCHDSAGDRCFADDGDEEIIELRPSGAGHLAQASPAMQKHPDAHSSYALPFALSHSQSLAQTSGCFKAETRINRHCSWSR